MNQEEQEDSDFETNLYVTMLREQNAKLTVEKTMDLRKFEALQKELEYLKEEVAVLTNYKEQAYEQLKRMNDVFDENKSLKEQLKQREEWTENHRKMYVLSLEENAQLKEKLKAAVALLAKYSENEE